MTKKKIIIILLVFLSANSLNAQTKFKKITDAVEALRIAMVDANGPMLSQLADDSLTYGHSSGYVDSKAAFIEALTSGRSDFVTMDVSSQTISTFKNTAIVRHTITSTTNDNGKPGAIKLHILMVWKKKNNTWKLIARQAVKIA